MEREYNTITDRTAIILILCCYNAMSQHRGDRNARCVRASWTETLSETLRVARVERTTGHETLKVYYVMYKLTVKGVYKTLSILKL
jgi:hypothetical protein